MSEIEREFIWELAGRLCEAVLDDEYENQELFNEELCDFLRENGLFLAKKSELQKSEEMLNAYLLSQGGPLNLAEADETANDLARSVIRAVYEDNGKAYLGVLNPKVPGAEMSWMYDGHEVKNFECDFVVPKRTKKLEDLLEKIRCEKSGDNFNELYYYVTKEIGGAWLLWR